MKKSKIIMKKRRRSFKPRFKVYGLIVLTLALTLLSVKAQFSFWKGLYGLETAVIASSVFETMRLASLFALLRWQGTKKIIGGLIYMGIALFCGSVAVTSWYSRILEIHARQEEAQNQLYQQRINTVKIAFMNQMQEKVIKVEQDLRWVENQLAKGFNVEYWRNRRDQYITNREELRKEIEAFLSEAPEDPEAWLEKNTARLGLELEPVAEEKTKLSAIEGAIQSTWNLSPEQAKMVVAIVFVVVIELGIILLAVIGLGIKRDDHVIKSDNLLETLTAMFDKDDVRLFVEKCRDRFVTTGDLPRASEITARLRPIRQAIVDNGFEESDLKALFDAKER